MVRVASATHQPSPPRTTAARTRPTSRHQKHRRMTAADLASPRLTGTIEAIEAHPAGPRLHPTVMHCLVWRHHHLTEIATSSQPVMQAIVEDELLTHGGINW